MSSRIALLSDIHANLPALKAVLGDMDRRAPVDPFHAVYCLGDLGGYAAEPNEVQALVMERGLPTILGNYDEGVGFERDDCGCKYVDPFDIAMSDRSFRWTRARTNAGHKAWLRSLPRDLRLDLEGHSVLLCHGSPRDTTEYLFENRSAGYLRQFTHGGRADAGVEVICFGHTHVPYHRLVDGTHFINTGSVGRPKDGDPRAGYCILTLDASGIQVEQVRVPYDVDLTCRRIAEAGLPAYFAAYLRSGGRVPEDAPERMLTPEAQLPV
jgi:diadenosine tetraphosphatase ApaH/serine/threonine PP2A family protein phosphatase